MLLIFVILSCWLLCMVCTSVVVYDRKIYVHNRAQHYFSSLYNIWAAIPVCLSLIHLSVVASKLVQWVCIGGYSGVWTAHNYVRKNICLFMDTLHMLIQQQRRLCYTRGGLELFQIVSKLHAGWKLNFLQGWLNLPRGGRILIFSPENVKYQILLCV